LNRSRARDIFATLIISLSLAAVIAAPPLNRWDGLSIDTLFWLRHQIYGPLYTSDESPTVVVALDEETYRRAPFDSVPKSLWTPQIATVIRELLRAGAVVVGQDLIFPTSVESYLRGHDRDYLKVLREAGQHGQIVLGKVQHLSKPISPYPGYSFAVGHGKNIRLVNLFRDDDGVIRRIPLAFRKKEADDSQTFETSFAIELASRALRQTPQISSDGAVQIGTMTIRQKAWNGNLINFNSGEQSLPVYSFADLHACHGSGNQKYFNQHFAGKVVILGAALDVEDRKLTAARFVASPDGAWFAERCHYPIMSELYDKNIVRDSIPGTFIFAYFINSILRNETLKELSAQVSFFLVGCGAFLSGLLALMLRLRHGAAILIAASGVWVLTATFFFSEGLVIPLIDPVASAVLAFLMTVGYRFVVSDSERRRIKRAFSYYLPPSVIEQMDRDRTLPELGGETRDVTVFFSDLAGFTRVCEGLSPGQVVQIMNSYLDAMTDLIEAGGGYVDKYIGDAILAIFGAPLADPKHATHAVEAALLCQKALVDIEQELGLPEGRQLRMRIGIHSGPALIGNIGSSRRFNYTAMGDTVNLASRLESANKLYGSDILMSESTASQLSDEFGFHRLERVHVQGRDEPVMLYRPLGFSSQLKAEDHERVSAFEAMWLQLETRNFSGAYAALKQLRDVDQAARIISDHLLDWKKHPPREQQVAFVLSEK
jgi:class 3 adenylate cyclase